MTGPSQIPAAASRQDGQLRLHVLPDPWGLNPSPFCLKVETYCRLAAIRFDPVVTLPLRAPRGKLPFIEHEGKRIPDSGLIIAYLKQHFGDPLDADLHPEQRATGHLIRRVCEESLYFVMLHARWMEPSGWNVVKPLFFGAIPPVLRDGVAALARRGIRRALYGQGYGRYSLNEIHALGAADLSAIDAVLSRQSFAVSDRPTSYDAAVYGLLANIVDAPVETVMKAEALRHASLVKYVERMRSVIAVAGA